MGVAYTCGSQHGTTGADGAFRFEVGKECAFSLGNLQIRTLKATQLADGAVIVESDMKVAALLQSLDADGDPEKRLTIARRLLLSRISVLESEMSSQKQVFNALLIRMQENSIEQETPDAEIEISNLATTPDPSRPTSPKPMMIFVQGGFGGLAVGVAFENLDICRGGAGEETLEIDTDLATEVHLVDDDARYVGQEEFLFLGMSDKFFLRTCRQYSASCNSQ